MCILLVVKSLKSVSVDRIYSLAFPAVSKLPLSLILVGLVTLLWTSALQTRQQLLQVGLEEHWRLLESSRNPSVENNKNLIRKWFAFFSISWIMIANCQLTLGSRSDIRKRTSQHSPRQLEGKWRPKTVASIYICLYLRGVEEEGNILFISFSKIDYSIQIQVTEMSTSQYVLVPLRWLSIDTKSLTCWWGSDKKHKFHKYTILTH